MYKVALISSAILLGACTGKVAPSGGILANTQWVLSGYESNVGVNTIPARYITLSFSADNKLGGMLGCSALQGEYSPQPDNFITLKASANKVSATCIVAQQDADFLAQLNTAKSFTSVDKVLAIQLADGSRLNFVQKFPGCANTLPISGSPSAQVEITTLTLSDDLITQYEKSNSDFTITAAAQNCSTSLVAAVNPNTLLQLQCDSRVTGLAYK